jgi:hypothetical protein
VSAIRDTRFGIGRTVAATLDTRVRLVVLVYCQARATLNDRLRPNAATTVDYRVGLLDVIIYPVDIAQVRPAKAGGIQGIVCWAQAGHGGRKVLKVGSDLLGSGGACWAHTIGYFRPQYKWEIMLFKNIVVVLKFQFSTQMVI